MIRQSSDFVCVIGAGPCGLASVKNLVDAGIPCHCFEAHHDLGGVWNHQTPAGRVHRSTRMISSKRLTEFVGFRMPREFPHYPRHDQALQYLRSYAEHYQLAQHIRFDTPVKRVERSGSSWRVTTSAGTANYRAVIIANGHHTVPSLPDWASDCSGVVRHASDYQDNDALEGQRVLVVGAGNSGCDIAVEAAQVADRAALSMRRGYHVIPKFLGGAPVDRCQETLYRWRLPWWLSRWIANRYLQLAVGPLDRYGLPDPDHRLLESHPIINSQLLHHLSHHNLDVRPDVTRCEGKLVTFADGDREEFDQIICATGYRVEFPFCSHEIPWDGNRPALYLNVFHPEHDDLFVVGLIQPTGGIWQLADYQAQLISRFLHAQDVHVEAAAWFRRKKRAGDEDGGGGLRFLKTPRHAIEVEYFRYRQTLQRTIRALDQRCVAAR